MKVLWVYKAKLKWNKCHYSQYVEGWWSLILKRKWNECDDYDGICVKLKINMKNFPEAILSKY